MSLQLNLSAVDVALDTLLLPGEWDRAISTNKHRAAPSSKKARRRRPLEDLHMNRGVSNSSQTNNTNRGNADIPSAIKVPPRSDDSHLSIINAKSTKFNRFMIPDCPSSLTKVSKAQCSGDLLSNENRPPTTYTSGINQQSAHSPSGANHKNNERSRSQLSIIGRPPLASRSPSNHGVNEPPPSPRQPISEKQPKSSHYYNGNNPTCSVRGNDKNRIVLSSESTNLESSVDSQKEVKPLSSTRKSPRVFLEEFDAKAEAALRTRRSRRSKSGGGIKGYDGSLTYQGATIASLGPSIIQKLYSSTGLGCPNVVQLSTTSSPVTPSKLDSISLPVGPVWYTNTRQFQEGSSCVFSINLSLLKIKTIMKEEESDISSTGKGNQVIVKKIEYFHNLKIHVVTDQCPSPGAALVASSSHHHSSGFVTLAKQTPFVDDYDDMSKRGANSGLKEAILPLKGSLIAPYVKLSVYPKTMDGGHDFRNIRILYVSASVDTDSSSYRESSVETPPTVPSSLSPLGHEIGNEHAPDQSSFIPAGKRNAGTASRDSYYLAEKRKKMDMDGKGSNNHFSDSPTAYSVSEATVSPQPRDPFGKGSNDTLISGVTYSPPNIVSSRRSTSAAKAALFGVDDDDDPSFSVEDHEGGNEHMYEDDVHHFSEKIIHSTPSASANPTPVKTPVSNYGVHRSDDHTSIEDITISPQTPVVTVGGPGGRIRYSTDTRCSNNGNVFTSSDGHDKDAIHDLVDRAQTKEQVNCLLQQIRARSRLGIEPQDLKTAGAHIVNLAETKRELESSEAVVFPTNRQHLSIYARQSRNHYQDANDEQSSSRQSNATVTHRVVPDIHPIRGISSDASDRDEQKSVSEKDSTSYEERDDGVHIGMPSLTSSSATPGIIPLSIPDLSETVQYVQAAQANTNKRGVGPLYPHGDNGCRREENQHSLHSLDSQKLPSRTAPTPCLINDEREKKIEQHIQHPSSENKYLEEKVDALQRAIAELSARINNKNSNSSTQQTNNKSGIVDTNSYQSREKMNNNDIYKNTVSSRNNSEDYPNISAASGGAIVVEVTDINCSVTSREATVNDDNYNVNKGDDSSYQLLHPKATSHQPSSSPSGDTTSRYLNAIMRKNESLWSSTPRVECISDLFSNGCAVIYRQYIATQTSGNSLSQQVDDYLHSQPTKIQNKVQLSNSKGISSVPIVLQPSLPQIDSSNNDCDHHMGVTSMFPSDVIEGYLSMPYQHFVIGIGDCSDDTTCEDYLLRAFSMFAEAVEHYTSGGTIIEPLVCYYHGETSLSSRPCHWRKGSCTSSDSDGGFVVRVGAQKTFTFLALSSHRIVEEVIRCNSRRDYRALVPSRMISSNNRPNSLSSYGGGSSSFPEQQTMITKLRVICWLDYPSSQFTQFLGDMIFLAGFNDEDFNKIGDRIDNIRGNNIPPLYNTPLTLTYFSVTTKNNCVTQTEQRVREDWGHDYEENPQEHPLLAFIEGPLRDTIYPTCWNGLRITGKVVEIAKPCDDEEQSKRSSTYVLHVNMTPHIPEVLKINISEPQTITNSREVAKISKRIILYNGHLLDLLLEMLPTWPKENNDDLTSRLSRSHQNRNHSNVLPNKRKQWLVDGAVICTRHYQKLHRIVGDSITFSQQLDPRIEVFPSVRETNGEEPSDQVITSSSIIRALAAANDRQWSTVCIWLDSVNDALNHRKTKDNLSNSVQSSSDTSVNGDALYYLLKESVGKWSYAYPSVVLVARSCGSFFRDGPGEERCGVLDIKRLGSTVMRCSSVVEGISD